MKPEDTLAKAHREKIEARLREAKARLDELDGTARERKAKAEIEAIVALRAKRDQIQARMKEFQDASDARASQLVAELDAKLANFQEELSKLATRVKAHSTRG